MELLTKKAGLCAGCSRRDYQRCKNLNWVINSLTPARKSWIFSAKSLKITSSSSHFYKALNFCNRLPTLSCNSMNSSYGLDINQANTLQSSTLTQEDHIQKIHEQMFPTIYGNSNKNHEHGVDQVTDWRVLDKFVASQLSQEDVIKEASVPENASTSTSSCQTDLWM
ncbi:hypothetical protein OIU76_022549 [Salix suchowensis]|nr:hypothetical protein OIU76_022549 [Salix suchowensis]